MQAESEFSFISIKSFGAQIHDPQTHLRPLTEAEEILTPFKRHNSDLIKQQMDVAALLGSVLCYTGVRMELGEQQEC